MPASGQGMQDVSNSNFGPEEFAAAADVSRETLARLKAFAGMLADWNARHNLVSRNSLQHVWQRHIWDSAQLVRYVPVQTRSLVDLGTGAGFPGLVLAELLRERAIRIVLYDSVRKKRDFLRAVADRLSLVVEIRGERIEDADSEPFDVITARACAPLNTLLSYAQPFWKENSVALFLKGQNVGVELTEAHKYWRMLVQKHQSRSSATGVLLEIRGLGTCGAR
jgi:16S rRNA (guanine527-N7)-methyltransferase